MSEPIHRDLNETLPETVEDLFLGRSFSAVVAMLAKIVTTVALWKHN